MNTRFLPNQDCLSIRWSDLETAWRMLAAPDKQSQISETLQTLQTLALTAGPEKAVFTMIAATAWLTDDCQTSNCQTSNCQTSNCQPSKEDWQA